MLLDHIDINTKMDYGSVLHYACSDLKMIKLLIQYGADINPKNNFGQTPLDYVTLSKNRYPYTYRPLDCDENFLIAKGAYGKVNFYLL
jgi:hypothetical protein